MTRSSAPLCRPFWYALCFLAVAGAASCGADSNNASSPTTASGIGTGGGTTTTTTGAGGSADDTGGPVELSGVFNARHTGGLTTSDGKRVRDNMILRSGHLGGLDSTGCAQFTALQIHSIVDLRTAEAATATPDAACATAAATYYSADLPKILPPSESAYLETLAATEPKLSAIFGELSKDAGLPAVIHCVIGRDRASLVTAIVLLSLGVPKGTVLTDFVDNQVADVTVQAAWLQAAIDHIDQEGGITAYLEQHGVTSAQLTALAEQALE